MDGSLGLGTDAESEALGWDPKPLAPEGGFGPAVWDGRRQPDGPWPALTEGDPEGPPEAQWLALTHLLRRSLEAAGAGDELPELPPWVETLATQSPSIPVRRAAGRVLTTHGKERGLQVLLQSLTFRSDDNPYIPQSGSIAAWVGRLIGQNLGSDPGAYRAWWRENKGDTSWLARLPAVQALDRAEIASSEGRVEDLREECKAAVKALPDAWGIRERAAELVGLWAWVLGHPESNVNADPATAAQLAQLAVSWDPRVPQYFIHLARALHRGGQTDLARRALEKAARVDPDHPELLALQRLVGDEEEQP